MVDHLDVFYTPEWQSWGFAMYDSENNQLGETTYHYLKRDAVLDAKRVASQRNVGVNVYTKAFVLQGAYNASV